jgi:DNA processing protein
MDLERPPPIFLRGRLVDRPHIAVVGTRRCTSYGSQIAADFGRYLAQAGWVTVSGLARGIDAAAHHGTLQAHGSGLAVLGCGIDTVYPKSNSGLLRGLLDTGGAVVSEYPDFTPPDRWRFPARNRIIAAISAAVVVVESAVTGGALITATLAAEIGRPVFAVPGDIDRPASVGTNLLIRDGAVPVLGPADLGQALALELGVDLPAAEATTL